MGVGIGEVVGGRKPADFAFPSRRSIYGPVKNWMTSSNMKYLVGCICHASTTCTQQMRLRHMVPFPSVPILCPSSCTISGSFLSSSSLLSPRCSMKNATSTAPRRPQPTSASTWCDGRSWTVASASELISKRRYHNFGRL